MSDDKKRTLWCGNWTQPFDGGGRTTGTVAEAIFDDQIVQVLSNPYSKAFYVRKSTQQGKEWDLWQKTEGYSDVESSSLVALFNSSACCLLHVAVTGDQVMWRTSSDTIVWSKWQSISGARSISPVSLILWKNRAWLYFLHTNKKFCMTMTENGETWTKVEELRTGPPVGQVLDVKKVHLQTTTFEQSLILTVVYADRVYVCSSSDGKTFSNWNAGSGQETNRPVETKAFAGIVFQARVGFDDFVYMRCSQAQDLSKWNPWTSAGIKTGSSISMCVYNSKLVQAIHGLDSEVYVRYTEDGRYWTKWSICGDERRKTQKPLTQIVYRNVLYQTLISMDDFAITRRITNKEDAQTRFKLDDTIVVGTQRRDDLFFAKFFDAHTYARLKSVGSEAPVVAMVLEKNQTLTNLDLSYSNIGNDGASAICNALSNHPAITYLSLNGNQINGALEAFQKLLFACKTLKTLSLASNRLGDEGAKSVLSHLEQNSSLTSLDLSNNGIERPGAQSLGEALLKTKSLRHINFSKNSILNDGCQAITSALESNKTITSMELSDSHISLEGSRAIAKMLLENSTLTKLIFSEQNLKRTEGTRPLAEALQVNSTLIELNLSNNHMGSEGATLIIDALAQNKVLSKLDLSGNDIEDEGLLTVTKALKVNRGLRELALNRNDFRRIGVTALASALANNSQITCLNLSDCAVSLDGIKALSTVLRAANTIKELRLSNCRLGNPEAEELSMALKSSQVLQIIDLDDNKFGAEGLKSIAGLIQFNPRIRSISMWGNVINGSLAKDYAAALKSNTYLKSLRLHLNSLDSEMDDLAPSLRTKQNLTELLLKGKFSLESIKTLSTLLTGNTYIQSLSLVDALMTDEGAMAFSTFLKSNSCLLSLDLTKNRIETKGVSAICENLAANTALTSLNLSENRLGFDSVGILANLLKVNKTLTQLNVDEEYTDQLDIAHSMKI